MKRTTVIVGAGFSAALTSGVTPVLGNGALPTLENLGPELSRHAARLGENRAEYLSDFSSKNIDDGITALKSYFESNVRDSTCTYNFEQFVSLLAFRASLFNTSLRDILPDLPGNNPAVLRFILHVLYDYFANQLAFDGLPFANRNFTYKVNDDARALAFRAGLHSFVDGHHVTFVSFNYDGILEAILGSGYNSSPPRLRYLPELSHGVPLSAPEYLLGRPDMRQLDANLDSVTRVLKPHGSMHFFQVRDGMRAMLGGISMLGITPHLDIGFDPATMKRDLSKKLRAWDYIDSTPFIVPPVINKDSFIGSDYFREMLQQTYRAIAEADYVVALGFSLPASDLHISALLEAIDWKGKQVALYHRDGIDGQTDKNWKRVVRQGHIETLGSAGIDCTSLETINAFWEQLSSWAAH